jgi:hypothetical protein
MPLFAIPDAPDSAVGEPKDIFAEPDVAPDKFTATEKGHAAAGVVFAMPNRVHVMLPVDRFALGFMTIKTDL